MKYSLYLGKPFGIKVAIHWTFLLLILWVVAANMNRGAGLSQAAWSVLFIIVLFICVTLHELGHSLAARKYGIETKSITLLPIGGMANIEKMPEEPKQEIVVTLSGLVVNVIIAGLLWVIISTIPGYNFHPDFTVISGKNFLILLMYTNLLLVLFNIIPAFPMDGGRILRAALSFRYTRLEATRYAMITGQVFGVIFALTGLFVNPFLFVIGVFVFLGARMEYTQLKYSSALMDHKVKEILMDDYTIFDGDDPLQKAVDVLLKTRQTGFLVGSDEMITGILGRKDIVDGLSNYGPDVRIGKVMTTDFDRIDANRPLRELFQSMQREKMDILPVFENDKLIGVIDLENMQEFIMVQSALG